MELGCLNMVPQGMAKEGYNYQAILKHYYQGVEISKNKE